MRLLRNLGILGLATATVFSSCTIQKRTAMPGYHVEWRATNTVKHSDKVAQEEKVNESFAIAPEKKSVQVSTVEQTASVQGIETNTVASVSETPVVTPKATEVKSVAKSVNVIATSTVSSSKDAQKASVQMKKLEKKATKIVKKANASDDAILYYILAFFIPFLAVGLVTDWEVKPVVINLILCFFFFIPGIIHALIVVSRNV